MGAPGRDRKDLPRKDLMYSREDDGDDDGEETTTMRQYLLIPEKCSATNVTWFEVDGREARQSLVGEQEWGCVQRVKIA
jgi:hypothetical protein